MRSLQMPTELERAWGILQPRRGKELNSFPLDLAVHGVPCRVAIDRDGLRHLLVPALEESLAATSRPSTLTVTVRNLHFDDGGNRYVDACVTEPDLHPEFDDLIRDVLDEVRDADRPGATALRTIGRWRRLFGSKAVRGLSAQARLGLFAELVLLRAVLAERPGVGLDVWTGPLRKPHDFELSRRCVEVKAVGAGSDSIVVHGIDQLDRHVGRPLDLVVMTVVGDPDGTTLKDLVDHVQSMTASPTALKELLGETGWTAAANHADTEPLAVSELIRVRVDDSTPRLTSSSLLLGELPEELSHLTYRLSRKAIGDHGQSASLHDVIGDAV